VLRLPLIALLIVLVCVPSASASLAEQPWPPAGGPGQLFVHYGEEHWNDDDGLTLLPKIVEETARYRPSLVTMSGDKDNDGTQDQLSTWKQIMSPYDAAGVPYLAGIGNHDRTSPPGVPPGTAGLLTPGVQGSLENYKQVFSDRPYPFGDQPNYPGIGPARPGGEPAGASSHYFADVGEVRWIFIDNSCWGIADCDASQSPEFPDAQGNNGQFEFLERNAREAGAAGKTVFVVMHMPTRDPRDQSYIDPTTFTHVMGKDNPAASGTPDNQRFEQVAERSGVDGVFLGHIKGQFTYRGRGNVPYFIDGGAGGELYTEGPVGADHGYWHGFRLLRVDAGRVSSDTVPIFVRDGIRLEGAESVKSGERARYEGFGRQPVFNDPAKVEALELRDPDPQRPVESASGMTAGVGDFVRGGGWVLAPVLLLVLGGVAMNATGATVRRRRPRRRRRIVVTACSGAAALIVGTTTMSMAQQSEPTTTPIDSLPNPARIFTTGDPQIMAPVASDDDDPRRDAATQTADGLFTGRCPGQTSIRVTSGFETTAVPVSVTSPKRATKILRRARIVRPRALRPGARRAVARISLRQSARVRVQIRRKGRTLATLRDGCFAPGDRALRTVSWGARIRRAGKLRSVRPGRVQVRILVRSDRKPVLRTRAVRVQGKRSARGR